MSQPLSLVQPQAVTPAMLTACTVDEDDYDVWSNATPYAIENRVIYGHKVYESAVNSNTNHQPDTSPDWWTEVGPTNRWKLFDGSVSSQTVQSTAMSYTVELAGGITALAALNVRGCNTARVRLTHPDSGGMYDEIVEMASLPATSDYWDWCFGERTAPTVLLLTDLPGIPGCTLQVDFAGTTDLAVGVLLFGQLQSIGIGVQQGMRLGIQDFSRKEKNNFGDTVLVQRAFAKRASFSVPIASQQVDAAIDLLETLRATPVLWIGSPLYGSSVIFGFYKEFEVVIAYRYVSDCSLDIEGLT